MLTVDYRRLGVRPGDRVLDLGCGAGRHSIEARRVGALAISCDWGAAELVAARSGEREAAEMCALPGPPLRAVRGDATRLPFASASFDRVIAAEVLEHIADDGAAIAELARVLRPGGTLAVTVPRRWTERICWALSDDYHTTPGGHLRIYRGGALRRALSSQGLRVTASHHAHALHSPYWWLRCAVGVDRESQPLVRTYHRLLVWDLMQRPRLTRVAERLLNPVLGKSLVLYLERPTAGEPAVLGVSREIGDAAA